MDSRSQPSCASPAMAAEVTAHGVFGALREPRLVDGWIGAVWVSRLVRSRKLEQFFAAIEKDALVLDFGCGEGWLARWLASRGLPARRRAPRPVALPPRPRTLPPHPQPGNDDGAQNHAH